MIARRAGLAVPSTRVDDEKLGPMADQVKDKVKETGQEPLDRGKQVAQDVASNAAETAKENTRGAARPALPGPTRPCVGWT